MAFLCFSKGKNRLDIKKGLKIAILTLFLGLFLFNVALADIIPAPFTDDFETYPTGNLPSPWVKDPNSAYAYWIVTTEKAYSGSKSIKSQQSASVAEQYRTFNDTATGGFEFYFFPTATSSSEYVFDFRLVSASNSAYYVEFEFFYSGDGHFYNISAGNVKTDLGLANLNKWNKIQLQFDSPNKKIRYNINDTGWTDWLGGRWQSGAPIQRVYITYIVSANAPVYLDKIDNVITPILAKPSSYYLNWDLEKPTTCQFPEPSKYNQVSSTTNFEVKGILAIPNDNPYIWYQLRLKFWNYNTNQILYFDYDLPNLTKNQTYTFDYFLDISSILSTSTDLIAFSLRAYGKDNSGNVYEDLYPPDCIIYLGLISEQPIFTPPEIQFPPQPELEDCSQYNIPDRWICEIKNAIKSIFLPSSEKINQLKQTMDLFKQKFPFNYINLFTNFYQDIYNGINETSTIRFKILGQSGNVDLAFWENQATIGGITQTFSHIIYNIFLFLFLFIFVLWLISYLKRIF